MSFILDALKKSELERQRQTMPGLVDAGMMRPRSRFPLWAIALTFLLGVNLVVLILVVSRSGLLGGHPGNAAAASRAPIVARNGTATAGTATAGTATAGTATAGTATAGTADGQSVSPASAPAGAARAATPAPAHSAAAATSENASNAGSAPFSPMDGAAEYAPEIPVEPTDAAAAQKGSALAQDDVPPAHAVHHREPKPIEHDDGPPDEVLPSISEINMTGPELHLDVHVFATQPSERFVYINMRKYREGQTLEEGPTVERIRRDGVVLSYQGIRFLLPRQH